MTNNEAREYFKQCGLTYANVTKDTVNKLRKFVSKELQLCTVERMYLRHKNKDSYYVKSGKLHHSTIKVKNERFEDRQGISFEPDGFIGFAGWADSEHTKPFIDAFIKWCDWLRNEVIK